MDNIKHGWPRSLAHETNKIVWGDTIRKGLEAERFHGDFEEQALGDIWKIHKDFMSLENKYMDQKQK